MKKLLFSVLFVAVQLISYSQSFYESFELGYSGTKVRNSLYKTIEFLDSRLDTSSMGFVKVGIANHNAKVLCKRPLKVQLQQLFDSIVVQSSDTNNLLLQLRKLSVLENTSGLSENGYCRLKAILYSKTGDRYTRIATIDTLATISAFDVTKRTLKIGGQLIEQFIALNLLQTTHDSISYTMHELRNIDSIETRSIPVYTTSQYVDGLYYSFKSFKNQKPDTQMSVKLNKNGSISSIKIKDEDGNDMKIKSEEVYALVYGGKPYIATAYGYYPLTMKNNKFFFIGKVGVPANPMDIVVMGAMFVVMGVIIASSPSSATYFVVLNHTDGSFIYYREIVTAED